MFKVSVCIVCVCAMCMRVCVLQRKILTALALQDWFSDFRSFINDKSKQRASFSDVISDYQVMYNDLFEPVDGAGGKLLRSKFAEVS